MGNDGNDMCKTIHSERKRSSDQRRSHEDAGVRNSASDHVVLLDRSLMALALGYLQNSQHMNRTGRPEKSCFPLFKCQAHLAGWRLASLGRALNRG